jgi:hypothetical protein
MSHLVTIETEVRDPAAIRAACARLQLPPPELGTFELFAGEVSGTAVRLPDWRYPVVADTKTGMLHYDNFNGNWGDQRYFALFLQSYAVEKAKLEARKAGHTATEQQLADGSIKLTIQLTGGAA